MYVPMMMIIVLNLECRIARTSNQESFPVKKMSLSFRLFSFLIAISSDKEGKKKEKKNDED